MSFWPPMFLCFYFLLISWLSRGLTADYWDGFLSILNALSLAGDASPEYVFVPSRPPMGSLILTPLAGGFFSRWGAPGVIEACHAFMPIFLIVLLWLCHRFYTRLYSPPAAALAVVLMAFNPILIRYAPFALFDIAAALFAIPFFWAAYRYLETPSAKSYGWAAAAYGLAVLLRYQLSVIILAPMVFGFLSKTRRKAAYALLLLPPAAYLLMILFVGAIFWTVSAAGFFESVGAVHQDLSSNILLANMIGKEAVPWYKYLLSLWRQLGPTFFFLMILGVQSLLKSDGERKPYLGWALLTLFIFMSFFINHKEQRHFILALPLVYAAVGQGVETLFSWLPSKPSSRWVVLVLSVIFFPWTQCLGSFRFLLSEPSIHSEAPRRLGALLDSGTPDGGCVGWMNGDVVFHNRLDVIDGNEQMVLLGAPVMSLFSRRRVVERRGSSWADCSPSMIVESRTAAGALASHSSNEALAKVYEVSAQAPGGRILRWEVFADDVRPVGAR